MRLIIVIREADADTANTAIAEATGIEADNRTFTVQLARTANPTVPVARICNWDVEATGRNRRAIAQRIADTLGVPLSELREAITTDGIVRTKRCIIVNGDRVSPGRVLGHLGLVVLDPGE